MEVADGKKKRYSAEQIVAKLREHEKLQAQGLTIPRPASGSGSPTRPSTAGGSGTARSKRMRPSALSKTSVMNTVAMP